MKRMQLLSLVMAAMMALDVPVVLARGFGGRGGGGGMGMGGGGFSRPSPSMGRSPSLGGGARPGGSFGGPSLGQRPGGGGISRPQLGGGAAGLGGGAAGLGGGAAGLGGGAAGLGGGAAGLGARPGTGRPDFAGGRPTSGQLMNFLDVPRPSTGAIGGAGGLRPGGAAGDFLREGGTRPSQLPAFGGVGQRAGIEQRAGADRLPGIAERPGLGELPGAADRQQRRQDVASNRPDRIDNRQQWQDNRQQRRDEVRNQVAENHPRLDFWSDHPNWAAWRLNRPYRWATWGALTGWLGYGAVEPVYYNYGDNVYYADNQVYYGDQAAATTEQYAQQAEAIAGSAPPTNPQDAEWMPLGVFAMTQDGQPSGGDPTLYMQLAVSKEGIISGTFKNMATGQVQTLEGMVDKQSQRAAWGIAGMQWPIVETGLSNLTQDTTPALIHFADGQTQQWLLVRLPDPQEGS